MVEYTHPFDDVNTAEELATQFETYGVDADVHDADDGPHTVVTVHLTNNFPPDQAKQAADTAGYAFVGDQVMDDGNLELTFVDADDVEWA